MAKKDDQEQIFPAAPEVERAVLGVILLNELAYHELVGAGLRRDYFSLDSHRRIYSRMVELMDSSRPIDMVTLIEELDRHRDLRAIGDVGYVSSLTDGVPDNVKGVHLREYVDILNDKYLRRQAILAVNGLAACAMDPGDPIRQSVALAADQLLRVQGAAVNEPVEFVATSTQVVLDEISDLMYVERPVIGIPYGIQDLDEPTTGLRVGEITTVGGYPGSAKTAFALNICRTAAKAGYPVAFFSLEMTKEQLILRLFAQESDINYSKLRNPKNLFREERRQLDYWKEHVDALPLLIDDQARTIEEIIPRAHLYIRKHGIKLIAIDYLQLIEAPGEKEYDKVSAASDAIWWLEKSTQVPIILLSQLSRPEGRNRGATPPPSLHMLRSSGKIEQNAHNVLLLHRGYDDDGAPTGEDLIVIAKQRAGLVGRVKATFNGASQRWEDRGATPRPQQPDMFARGVAQ
jgi:replicative DNA helicase